MTPVRFRDRDQQMADHMASFVFQETLEDQIKAADCGICMEPLGLNSSEAPPRAAAAQATPFYVDYCGNNHYFHKWCAHGLLTRTETTPCPDCRAEPTDNARIEIAESYPMPGAGAPAAAPAAAPVAPAPAAPAATRTRLPRLQRGEERLGAQRATDTLIQWHFWLKPADSAAEDRLSFPHMNDRMRNTFDAYMLEHFNSPQAVGLFYQRLEVDVMLFHATFVGDAQPTEGASVALITCKMWLPAVAAQSFMNFFAEEKRMFRTGSMMRRWLGTIGAEIPDYGEHMRARMYARWSYLQDNPEARPDLPDAFTSSRSWYNNWRPYSLEDDPMPIIAGRNGPQRTTDVAVEWRLWVKGRFPEDTSSVATHVRNHLSRWFHNQAQFESQRTLDIRERLSMVTSYGSVTRSAVPDSDSPVSRIDCQLYLPNVWLARAFVDACTQMGQNGNPAAETDLELVFRTIIGVADAGTPSTWQMPVIREGPLTFSKRMGSYPYERVQRPNMTQADYDSWSHYVLLPLPPAIEVGMPGPSEPGPSSSAAFQEQARRERLNERDRRELRRWMVGFDSDGNTDEDGDSPDEDEDSDDEEIVDQGTVGDAGPSDEGAYVPTSPAYSPTSPPPTPPSATIDPMTPDREVRESIIAQRAYRFMDPNDPEYAVTIRWRFWLKGSMGSRQVLDAEEAMRSHFATYMANNADFRAGNNGFPWYHRLRVEIFEREYMTLAPDNVATIHTEPILRCEVSLKVSQSTAYAFTNWAMDDRNNRRRNHTWAKQAEAWHKYGPAQALEASDFPRVVDLMTDYPLSPDMLTEDYYNWGYWRVLRE
jgi:hypothetical protein